MANIFITFLEKDRRTSQQRVPCQKLDLSFSSFKAVLPTDQSPFSVLQPSNQHYAEEQQQASGKPASWGHSGKRTRKQGGNMSLHPINHYIHVNWMSLSKKKKAYSSKTEKFHTAVRHVPLLLQAGFSLCPESVQLASPAPCSSRLQLPPGMHAPSDVAHGHRKVKIKQRPVVTANTMPSATHRLAGIITQRAAIGDGQCPSITNGGRPPPTSLHPQESGQNRLCPLLSQSKNLSVTKETSLQKASTRVLKLPSDKDCFLSNLFASVQPPRQLTEDKC